jgi:NAD(P)-dependent dehydrogenase (short-subunit alcohol dehydrogenase family)
MERIRNLTGNQQVEYLLTDLSSLAEVRRLAAQIKQRFASLDVLVNNAGAFFSRRSLSAEGYEMTFALNHLSYFLLTDLLLPLLRAAADLAGEARIVNVASNSHRRSQIDFEDLHAERRYSAWRAYGQSKLANVLFTFELSRRLQGTRVAANALHPGFVATNIGKNNGLIYRIALNIIHRLSAVSPQEGARTSIYLASSPEVRGVSGLYFVDCQPVQADPAAYDLPAAAKLWAVSEQLCSRV